MHARAGGQRARTSATGAAGVQVDAVKLADDGSGDLVVRFHEAVGNRTALDVQADRRVVAAWQCNLLEEPTRAEEVGDGIVAMTAAAVPDRDVAPAPRRRSTAARSPEQVTEASGSAGMRGVRPGAGVASAAVAYREMPVVIAASSKYTRFEWFGAAVMGSRSSGVPPRNIIAPGTFCSR